MKPAIAAAAFAAGLGLAAAAQADPFTGKCEDFTNTITDEHGNCVYSPCEDHVLLKDANGRALSFATMKDENGNCVFSVRNATVGKQHDEIVEKLGARIDALTEEVSELRAAINLNAACTDDGTTITCGAAKAGKLAPVR